MEGSAEDLLDEAWSLTVFANPQVLSLLGQGCVRSGLAQHSHAPRFAARPGHRTPSDGDVLAHARHAGHAGRAAQLMAAAAHATAAGAAVGGFGGAVNRASAGQPRPLSPASPCQKPARAKSRHAWKFLQCCQALSSVYACVGARLHTRVWGRACYRRLAQ